MKKILSILLMIGAITAQAQLTFDDDTVFIYADQTAFEHGLKSKLTNNSSDTLFRFIRISDPTCDFTTAVCDQNLCYPETTDTAAIYMYENESFDMKVNFYPANTDGCCGVMIYVKSLQTPENYDSCYFKVCTFDPAGIGALYKYVSVKTYPNPGGDYIRLETPGKQAFEISIYSHTGQQILTMDAVYNHQAIDVSSLLPGIYFIRVKTEDGFYNSSFRKL